MKTKILALFLTLCLTLNLCACGSGDGLQSDLSDDETVYVSESGGKIHTDRNCCGMKHYDTMTYGEACDKGYSHCEICFK